MEYLNESVDLKAIKNNLVEKIKQLVAKIEEGARKMVAKIAQVAANGALKNGSMYGEVMSRYTKAMVSQNNAFEDNNHMSYESAIGKVNDVKKAITEGKTKKNKSNVNLQEMCKKIAKDMINTAKLINKQRNHVARIQDDNEVVVVKRRLVLAKMVYGMQISVISYLISCRGSAISRDFNDKVNAKNAKKKAKEDKKKSKVKNESFEERVKSAMLEAAMKEVEKLVANVGYADDAGKQKTVESLSGNANYADDAGKQKTVEYYKDIEDPDSAY